MRKEARWQCRPLLATKALFNGNALPVRGAVLGGCGVVLLFGLASAPAAAGCPAADRDVFGFCPDGTYGGSTYTPPPPPPPPADTCQNRDVFGFCQDESETSVATKAQECVENTAGTNCNDGQDGTSGNDATQNPLGGDSGGSPAPDVPTEQPTGLLAGIKRSLVKKIWSSLDADQQQQARNALQDWLEEQGYDSCHAAAADPETARHAAGQLLSSDGVQISDSARKWANRILRISSGKGMSTTATIVCNQMGL